MYVQCLKGGGVLPVKSETKGQLKHFFLSLFQLEMVKPPSTFPSWAMGSWPIIFPNALYLFGVVIDILKGKNMNLNPIPPNSYVCVYRFIHDNARF